MIRDNLSSWATDQQMDGELRLGSEKCQSQLIDQIGRENSWLTDARQKTVRKVRFLRRRLLRALFASKTSRTGSTLVREPLRAGEIVCVRSKSEIKNALDEFRKTQGCTFQAEMFDSCGKYFKVFKKIDHFYDESHQKMCRSNNLYLLEGSFCSGRVTYSGRCDRNCFYFWHADWLRKARTI
jgi:hypothetical protein